MITNPKVQMVITNIRRKYKETSIIASEDIPNQWVYYLRQNASGESSVIGKAEGHEIFLGEVELNHSVYALVNWKEEEVFLELKHEIKE